MFIVKGLTLGFCANNSLSCDLGTGRDWLQSERGQAPISYEQVEMGYDVDRMSAGEYIWLTLGVAGFKTILFVASLLSFGHVQE